MNAQLQAKLLKPKAKVSLSMERILLGVLYIVLVLGGFFYGPPLVLYVTHFITNWHPTWWQFLVVGILVLGAWIFFVNWLFKGGVKFDP